MKSTMDDRQFEELLKKEIDSLPRDISPRRDLWPGIDHAINTRMVTLPRWVAVAAGIVLVISLAVSGTLYISPPRQETTNPAIADFIATLQSDHARNKQALLVEYRNQTALAPDWEEQMNQLEQAEQAIYQALRDDPENLELLKILRQVQTKQIDLIESVYAPLFRAI